MIIIFYDNIFFKFSVFCQLTAYFNLKCQTKTTSQKDPNNKSNLSVQSKVKTKIELISWKRLMPYTNPKSSKFTTINLQILEKQEKIKLEMIKAHIAEKPFKISIKQ